MWVWVNAQAARDLGYEAGQASPVPTWEPCQATPFGQSLLCVVDAYPSNQQTHIIYRHIRVLGLSTQDLDTPNNNGMVEYQAIHLPLCLVSTPVYLVMFSPHSSYQSINFSPCAQAGYGFLGRCTGGMAPGTELTTVPLTT